MKILLIEDDQSTSELISTTLCAHHYAVDTIDDGVAGLDLATRWSYDLILLDILLPGLNGIEVCRRLRAQGCQAPILMLTTKDTSEDIVQGLDAGADDYLAKSCDSSQLLARVRALLRRCGNVPPSPILSWGSLCLDPAAARVTYSAQEVALRPKEYALLELFLRHPQRILSRSAIIDHLWSMEDTPVEGSITNLIKDLRHRLKSAGMETDLIETVYGLGYRLKDAPIQDQSLLPNWEGETGGHHSTSKPSTRQTDRLTWEQREQQGLAKIQQITERFQDSLKHRIAWLEAAERSLLAGEFSVEQRQVVCTEAHKLAGGLGTFGHGEASKIAQKIETLLAVNLSQETHLTHQLSQLLEELKRSLAEEKVPLNL